MENRIQDSFEGYNRATDNQFLLNEVPLESKEKMLEGLILLLEESLQDGDIEGNVLDLEAYQRYVSANKIGLPLFINPRNIETECSPHLSFAMTTIICESFGYDTEDDQNVRDNNKERYKQFVDVVDHLYVGSGPKPTEIMVTFTVNNVFREEHA